MPKVGQEIENAKFIIDKGLGMIYSDDLDLKNIFYKLVSNEFDSIINFMKKNLKEFKTVIHPEKTADYISELIDNHYS